MADQPSILDVALGPPRLVLEALQALPRIADGLDRIAGVSESLAQLADTLQGLDQLSETVNRLEAAAEELTRAVQPLQGVASRLNRLGRRGSSEVSGGG